MPIRRIPTIVHKLPLALIAGLAGFSVVTVILLLLEKFQTGLLWSLGTLAALVCMWGVFRFAGMSQTGNKKETLICDTAVLLGVLVWGGWNFMLTSQHIMTNRDPATYAVTAAWLSQNDSFTEQSTTTFQEVNGISPRSAGFSVDTATDTLYPQGQHLFPALLGAVGKLVGPSHMLHFNVLFGMTALLAVYCFARIVLMPRWALVATGIMAFTLPLIYFSRDMYTEPLLLTFTFGSLAFIAIAQKTRQWWAWVLAGLTLGVGILTRIDAYLAVVGVAAFMMVYVALSSRSERGWRWRELLFVITPVVLLGFLAWLDLKLFSPGYYASHKIWLLQEIAALIGVLVIGGIAAMILTTRPSVRQRLHVTTKRWRAGAAALLVLIVGLIFVVQPLWHEGQAEKPNELVSEVQKTNGMEEEQRSYQEIAPQWVSWYIGPVLSVLGIAGLAYAMYRAMLDKNLLLLCGLFVVLGTALVYFIRPSITPDQIWAARRMLPVVIPGVIVFGTFAIAELVRRIQFSNRHIRQGVVGVGVVALVVAPLLTSAPFLGERFLKQIAIVDNVCRRLPDNAIVIWLGLARMEMVQSTRAYCNLESYGYNYNNSDIPSKETLTQIAKIAKERNQVVYVGSYSHQIQDVLLPADQKALREIISITYSNISPTLTSAPYKVDKIGRGVSMAEVQPNGKLTPLPKAID